MYDKTITILNKHPSGTWYKTVLHNAEYQQKSIVGVSGTETVFGKKIIVLIPFNDKYLPYREWKDRLDRENYYTISEKDYVVLDELTENVTNSTIVGILKNYPKCEIRLIQVADNRMGANVQLKLEGV